MNRPGPISAATPPSAAAQVGRVILSIVLALVPLVSLGFLTWVPMLWLAAARRRLADWIGFGAVTVINIGGVALAGYTDDYDDWQTNTGVGVMFGLAGLGSVYVLVVDLRRQFTARRAAALPFTDHTQPYPLPPYPYPAHPRSPYPASPYPASPYPQPQAVPPPLPQPGARSGDGSRIGQVRAELDELSDYLRQQGDAG